MAASVLLNITMSVSCNCDIRLDGEKITCQSLAGTQIATLPVNDGFKLIAMLFTRVVCSMSVKGEPEFIQWYGGKDCEL